MKRLAMASTAALVCALTSHAHAADEVQIHLDGAVSSFIAVTEVKGFNCSQYNPCNPTDPAYYSTQSFGALAMGQRFTSDIRLDLSTAQAINMSWVSSDGSAAYGGPAGVWSSTTVTPSFSNDVFTIRPSLTATNGGSPVALNLTYALTFAPGTFGSTPVSGADLAAAVAAGKLVSTTGSAYFDSCRMVQNYWGQACGGRMSFNINNASITAVPEAQTWAMLMLGLGLIAVQRVSTRSSQKQTA